MTNTWPTGADAWIAYAARCTAHYPAMLTDWDAHAGMMKARRNAAVAAAEAGGEYLEPSLTPEEEEELQNCTESDPPAAEESAQMQLFTW